MLNEYDNRTDGNGVRIVVPIIAAAALLGGGAGFAMLRENPSGGDQEGALSKLRSTVQRDLPEMPVWLPMAAAGVLGLLTGMLLPRTRWEQEQVKRAAHDITAKVEGRVASELWSLVRSKAGM
jgi:hypothetical protein